LIGEGGRGFVMYGTSGRSWVSMGDPIGPPDERAELVWRFREACNRHATWPVFYEVTPDLLPIYLDVGLVPLKTGEEARVDLHAFSLEGSARKEDRHILRHVERAGASFEIIAPDCVPDILEQLKAVSDAWLTEKNTREKSFSIGSFRPDYLANFPIAVVRKGDAIVAFANLWRAAEKAELAPDLMRYSSDAPTSVMNYLFLNLMLWGQRDGYRWFNLGGAPLSGLGDHQLSPLWHRLGSFLFRYGEHFYNFQGLRSYKEKFDPVWRPVYLVSPGGLTLPRIVSSVAALVSGGLTGVVKK